MKRVALALLLLAGCGQTQQEKDASALAEKVTGQESEGSFASGLPDQPLRCDFTTRAYCIGAECRALPDSKMYIEISKPEMTYKRCGPKAGDCGTYRIEFLGQPYGYQNIVIEGGGTIFKLGPRGQFTDIATQGPQTFVSEGECKLLR